MIWDIIIAGGGIAGSVLSTRLAQSNSSLNILLIEAGKNVSGHPLTSAPLDSFAEHYSELDWAYSASGECEQPEDVRRRGQSTVGR
jgi:flavin-dependent dehydrogenase